MRTLLIDNHDSFTYNLYQYLAACNDEEPVVVKNDEKPWSEICGLSFDNIVISPGPGRPQRHSDLGISADALQHARVPVLGVCLGHQAIAHHCGATVDLAVRPMHGRLDRIAHGSVDLFAGIPNNFEAVRYHSLAVTDLPSELEPLAWTADGTLMALRHVSRPWWGVQFHPESICTEYGARLLRNFRELTHAWRGRVRKASSMGSFLPEFRLGQDPAPKIHARCIDALPDPEQVFDALFSDAPTSFWLDSSLVESGRARFSFMGDGSGPRSKRVTYRCDTQELAIHAHGAVNKRTQSIFDYLRDHAPAPRASATDLPFDFAGGHVGYFGYELKRELGGHPAHLADTPDAAWIVADRFIAFDHVEQQTWIVCLDDEVLCAPNAQWLDDVEQRMAHGLHALEPDWQDAACGLGPLRWRIDLPDYRARIVRAQQEILQGETYEVCLTNQLVGEGTIDAWAVYRALRARTPAPYAAFLKMPEVSVLCASPELFLRIGVDASVETRPIKGTAGRGVDAHDDERIKAALQADEKTRAENLMIVDLLRNDLNRVCDVGTVHVPRLFEIESFATVHQMVSTVRGRLRARLGPIDGVCATFPGGSMTGAPKERTMRILDGLEEAARGVYAGSIGYLSFNGSAELNIVIRTIVCTDGRVSIGTGGAIIALSDPDEEVAEIVLKARAPWEVLQQCGGTSAPMPTTDGYAPPAPADGNVGMAGD
jgi:para-aminobenzoate synthetase